MQNYLDLVDNVLSKGIQVQDDRTGVGTLSYTGGQIEYSGDKFPLLTSKKINYNHVLNELEMFIHGIHNKKFLQDRGTHIWDLWSSPSSLDSDELGPIYGVQWRSFSGKTDQLCSVLDTLATNPSSRRLLVSAWNPCDLEHMALPPCHFAFQLLRRDDKLDLIWYQRSADLMVGVPYNLASYATLQNVIAEEFGYNPGKIVGQFGDLHIYNNHIENARLQLSREPRELPTITVNSVDRGFNHNVLGFRASDVTLNNYNPHPWIRYPVAK